MPRANEIKKGMVLNYNGKLLIVKDIDIQAPSARGAATLYKMRFADVRTGLKVEERFKGDDIVDTVTLTRRYVDFSYIDGNEYVFMDKEDYTPYIFTKDQIEEELLFIPEGGMPDMQVLTWDGVLLALELPQTVDLEIVETAPGIKGASASARNKPATLTTGLVVQVPQGQTEEQREHQNLQDGVAGHRLDNALGEHLGDELFEVERAGLELGAGARIGQRHAQGGAGLQQVGNHQAQQQ